jgi:histidine triad (HIT) family protein
MTDECLFCKIGKGEIPSDEIYQDENIFAFLDIRPVNKGHALVIPKKHTADLLETEDAELALLISGVKKIAKGIMEATGASGFNLGVNTKPAAGQVVFHTHFHIIPRYVNDGLKLWPNAESEPKTRAEMAAEIKKHL